MLGKFEGMITRGQKRMNWMDGIINSVNKSLSKLQKRVKNREACIVVVQGVEKSWI